MEAAPAAKSTYFVGIAGGSGSGKTTLARMIAEHAPAGTLAIISVDSYYRCNAHLPFSEREKINYDHPSSLELELLEAHIDKLRQGSKVDVPNYNFSTHMREGVSGTVLPAALVVIEGILALYRESLRCAFDYRVYVDAPSNLRFRRRLERDVRERGRSADSVKVQWDSSVHPMHLQFCEPTRAFADIVVDGGRLSAALGKAILDRAGVNERS